MAVPTRVERSSGRKLFGFDPAAYDRARPDYPEWVFDTLADRCGLAAGARVLEIGPGTGKATRRLIAHGASVVGVEPDPRLAEWLRQSGLKGLAVVESPFETADLGAEPFDLAVSATAFHWLDEDAAIARVGELLRPGGWCAPFWNVYGDPERADPFHEATRSILAPEGGEVALAPTEIWYPIDAPARLAAFERSGLFEAGDHILRPWSVTLDPDQVVELYASFSPVIVRDDRAQVLDGLRRVAAEQFPAGVTRNMITSLYMARRR